MRFQSVTFDLDGTLLDTVPDLHAAALATLSELGLPPRSENEIRNFVGQGVVVLVRRCLTWETPPEERALAEAVEVFQRHYAAFNGKKSRIFEGVREGLDAWRATGLPLAVVTNKPAAFTEPLIERMGLAAYFSTIVSGDTTPHRKPHPAPLHHACRLMQTNPATNLHIGDSRHDIETARNAGCTVYCVPYGYNEGEPVKAEDCDALVESLGAALQAATNCRGINVF
ncbi:MAG: 2-phosphoglycolate phosphatase [Proteobacteria bacterium]|nr:2-phosphoglycolate phosphatase [Pseudomonadota bacterium]